MTNPASPPTAPDEYTRNAEQIRQMLEWFLHDETPLTTAAVSLSQKQLSFVWAGTNVHISLRDGDPKELL